MDATVVLVVLHDTGCYNSWCYCQRFVSKVSDLRIREAKQQVFLC